MKTAQKKFAIQHSITLSHLIRVLGLESLPEMPEDFWQEQRVQICVSDVEVLDGLEKEYALLGSYYQPTRQCAMAVAEDVTLCAWSNCIASYIASHPFSSGTALVVPQPKGEAFDYYYLLILASLIRGGIDAYRARGFSEEEIRVALVPSVRDRVTISEEIRGASGLDRGGFNWLLHYAKALVFPAGIFNITPRVMYEPGILLRHRISGEWAVLVLSGKFHRSGVQLGSGGCMDEEGAFDATLFETEEALIGCAVSADARVFPERRVYLKAEWQEIARRGDGIVGIHIPRGARLTEENIRESFALAFRLSCERYPEVNVRAVHCSSWILDPQLGGLLGAESKIAGFGNQFLRYPMGGDGTAVYHFVFCQSRPDDLTTLPEDTTLQRKIKALYLDGGCIYITGGFVADDSLIKI
ncbi:MAG: hypothetical protein IJX80_10225 [Clostridia bacterium]|nr:hypothetical protein [Clostridia bacterium]